MRCERFGFDRKSRGGQLLAQFQHQRFEWRRYVIGRNPADGAALPATRLGQIKTKGTSANRRTDGVQFVGGLDRYRTEERQRKVNVVGRNGAPADRLAHALATVPKRRLQIGIGPERKEQSLRNLLQSAIRDA